MTEKKKKIIVNIVFYVVLAIIYALAILIVITKFNGGTIYLFNNRTDIVLTNSMSYRNENHLDFLEGTTQIQPFDMVVSEKIDDNTELKVKDCVLFNNPNLDYKLVVHRIIDVIEKGTSFKVEKASKANIDSRDMISLDPLNGVISMDNLDFTKIEIEAYTPREYAAYFVIHQGSNIVEAETVTTKISDNLYKHVITYSRSTAAPYRSSIRCAVDEEEYIEKITYTSKSKGEITFTGSELEVDESSNYQKYFFPYYLYEIRADIGTTADGVFERKALLARVHTTIPKLGYVVHFLQSIPGLIALVGLAIVISVASFFWTKQTIATPSIDTPIGETGDSGAEEPSENAPEEVKEESPPEEKDPPNSDEK